MMNFQNIVSPSNARAITQDRSSPFNLNNRNGGTFTESGSFLVAIIFGTNPMTADIYYMSGVVFSRGSATINFADMSNFRNLPVW